MMLRAVYGLFPVSMVMLIGACSDPGGSVSTEPSDGAGRDLGAGVATSYAALEQEYPDVIAAMPVHSASGAVLEQFLALAKAEGGTERDPHERLMDASIAVPVQIAAFEAKVDGLAPKGIEFQVEYCTHIADTRPGTPISAAALDKKLRILQGQSNAAFLDACAVSIGSKDPLIRRTGLFRRAMDYRERREMKRASLDFIRIRLEHPTLLTDMGYGPTVNATLKAAGLILEAQALMHASSATGSVLLQPFGGMSDDGAQEKTDASGPPIGPYWQTTPDLPRLLAGLDSTEQDALSAVQRASGLARTAAVACWKGDAATATALASRFAGEEEAALGGSLSEAELALLYATGEALLLSLKRMLDTSDMAGDVQALSKVSPPLRELLVRLGERGLQAASRLKAPGAGAPASRLEAADELVGILVALNDLRRPVEVYERMAEQFPDAGEAPQYLLRLADLYQGKIASPPKAADTLFRLCRVYPDSRSDSIHYLRACMLLLEAEQYEEAYDKLLQYEAEHPEGPEAPLAKLVAAMCEASLGTPDTALKHALEIVQAHPQSPAAPRALYWAAMMELQRQDHKLALMHLRDLQERYPKSAEAQRATQYVDRLEDLEAKAGQP